ncbi:heterokaryon incompatibility protein-domain-containing protein [Fusarium flagelliforme]|nr:heterokaryon incompatibility protein-domain-containing protein [Fusarium flagelliforme]KAH7191703.1 heterokaryon incompatibility protein-domain-containing protein [Fusarium flagelliforme]
MRPSPLERSRLCAACSHACAQSIIGCGPVTCPIHWSQYNLEKRQYISDIRQDWDRLSDILGWAKWSKTKREFLAETNSSGCHLCIIIAHAFDDASKETFGEMEPAKELQLCFAYRTIDRDPSGMLDWQERTSMSINDITLESHLPDEFWLQIRPGKDSVFTKLYIDLRLRPLQETDTNHILKTLPGKQVSTMNEQNLQLALRWIKSCNRSHPKCKAFQHQMTGWRPTRLIYVGPESEQPKLIISRNKSRPVPYVALSYCWGSSNSVTLSRENISDFQKEIYLQHLPATIQSAIATTKDLGYQYLWVDSLCIIQNSENDWAYESSRMGDIYGMADITLAAAGGSSVQDPMFYRRDPRAIRPCVANIMPDYRYTKLSYPWAIYPHQAERMLDSTINESPLSRRAWALQELLLSPRTLIFGSKQMVWSCATTEASEGFPLGLDPKFSTPLSEDSSLSQLRQRLMRISDVGEPPSRFWNDFISRYTRSRLSVGSDTLVALQGLVGRIMMMAETRRQSNTDEPGPNYVAGLWHDRHFQQTLLWRPKVGSTRSRPEAYRAPSWSWASIDGDIDFFEQYIPWLWNRMEIEFARVVDVKAEPGAINSSSATGAVTSGYIDVQCHVRPCMLLKTGPGLDGSKNYEQYEALIVSSEEFHRLSELQDFCGGTAINDLAHRFADSCTIDIPEEIPDSKWTEVYCIPLQLGQCQTDRYEQSIWESYEGLVVVPVHNGARANHKPSASHTGSPDLTKTFRRIGTFRFDLHEENRAARQAELFGNDSDLRERRELIRII